jgi:hypothetical protein
VNASAALQRLPQALVRLRGPSRTQARAPRVLMGCTRPVRRFHALQALSSRAVPQPKLQAALHGLPLLFRARSPGPRAVSPVARQVRRRFLSWTSRALRHSLRPADPFAADGSLRRRVPRAGFDYPLRDLHHRSSRRDKRAGASMGFTLQGLPLVAIGTPLGAHCPPVVTPQRRASPEGCADCKAGFRAFFPQRVRAVAGTTNGPGRRSLPGVSPSRACSRSTWRSLWSRRLPPRPSAA